MTKQNKIKLIILPVLLVIAILVAIYKLPNQKFYLEDSYYKTSEFITINNNELEKLIKDKKSFVLFVYQPACVTSANFEKTLNEFLKEETLQIYKISFSDMKNTDLSKYIKYYPSFAIFSKGQMRDYLDASSDEDLPKYENKEQFKKWLTKYVILKENNQNLATTKENKETQTIETQNINLENVTKEENKINIYMFWGSTCPHCKEEFAFFNEIEQEYGNYYNLYEFEVWQNTENRQIMNAFAQALGDETSGAVPYTIIGDTSFNGFSESSKEKFKEAIKKNHKNAKDVYFDKIKNN